MQRPSFQRQHLGSESINAGRRKIVACQAVPRFPLVQVRALRAGIERVIVQGHQLGEQGGQCTCLCPVLPARNDLLAVQFFQHAQLPREQGRVVAQVGIVAQQKIQPRRHAGRDLDAGAGAQALHQGLGHGQAADLAAFGLDVDGALQIKGLQRMQQVRFESGLRGLFHTWPGTQHRSPVAGAGLQVKHLRAARCQGLQHARLGAAGGATNHAQGQLRRQFGQPVHHMATPRLVAASQLLGIPAHQAQPGHHRAAAHAAAPAVDQGLPAGRLIVKLLAQMPRQVGCHHGAAHAPRLKGALLLVNGAHNAALVVIEHRAIDGARDVIECVFGGRTRIDQGVKRMAVCHAHGAAVAHGAKPLPRAARRSAGTIARTMTVDSKPIRLTQFSHGGGCGCKIAPGLLQEILARAPQGIVPPELLVGNETSDDAAVYRLNDSQALVATTDFFTPIVDDPYDFGRIAATNALSDIYAMGGTPIMALALVGMPIAQLPPEVIGRVLEGGAAMCREAGIPIAGGHSIDVLEPIYGLVGLGLVHPQRVRRNADAQAGDVLVLGKPLGVGILSAALKKGILDAAGYADMLRYTTQLNRVGIALGALDGLHAMTDVTGFGLAGHLLEVCRGSGLSAQVNLAQVPFIEAAARFAAEGVITGASARNWTAYGADVAWAPGAPEWQRHLLTDPQTSGGLLVSCSADALASVLDTFRQAGFAAAAAIGGMQVPAQGQGSRLVCR